MIPTWAVSATDSAGYQPRDTPIFARSILDEVASFNYPHLTTHTVGTNKASRECSRLEYQFLNISALRERVAPNTNT